VINSKKLKSDKPCCEDPYEYPILQKIKYYFKMYVLYPPLDFYTRYKERISRSLAFAKFGWGNYDYDFGNVWHLLYFKLRRLKNALENGHAIQDEEDMKALGELLRTVKRLRSKWYERPYWDAHDKKWGKLESKTEPCTFYEDGSVKTYQWISWRAGTKDASKKVKAQELRERRKGDKLAEKDRLRDIERVGELIRKHSHRWWD
jgi:hypothetical protein